MKNYANVDAFLAERETWQGELTALRAIMLSAGLTETIKWGHPCYTDQGKNIAILGSRKSYAIVTFFKGALIEEPQGRFVRPGQERSGRYLPYSNVRSVEDDRAYLGELIGRAVEVERAGLRVEPLADEIDYVEELRERMQSDEDFRSAFEALTPGRRRQYNFHFAGAKKSSSRLARVDRCTARILTGKGLLDCICGHSKRMPRCDGSHKDFQ